METQGRTTVSPTPTRSEWVPLARRFPQNSGPPGGAKHIRPTLLRSIRLLLGEPMIARLFGAVESAAEETGAVWVTTRAAKYPQRQLVLQHLSFLSTSAEPRVETRDFKGRKLYITLEAF